MSFALSITPPTSARKCRTCVALVPVGHKRAYRQMGRCDSCAHTEFTRRTRLGFVFLAPRARVIEPIVARMRERAHLEHKATFFSPRKRHVSSVRGFESFLPPKVCSLGGQLGGQTVGLPRPGASCPPPVYR